MGRPMNRLPEYFREARRKKFLAAAKNLKDSIGAVDDPERPDDWKDGRCRIYTKDENSAEALSELFYQVYYGDHTIGYWVNKKGYFKDFIRVNKISDKCYEVYVPMDESWLFRFRDMCKTRSEMHNAPIGCQR